MLTSRWFGGTPTTSRPCSRIWPRVGSSKPPIIRSVVVLPHPDGPSSEKNSPSPMIRSTCSTAATRPRREWYVFAMPTSSIAGRPDASSVSDARPESPALTFPPAVGDFSNSMYVPCSPNLPNSSSLDRRGILTRRWGDDKGFRSCETQFQRNPLPAVFPPGKRLRRGAQRITRGRRRHVQGDHRAVAGGRPPRLLHDR